MADRTVIYTYVVGDLLHIGHLKALQQAKALGDYLIVGVLTDEATATYKRQPVIPFEQRIELVASLKCVDLAVRQDTLDPTKNIKELKEKHNVDVDIVTHGADWDKNFPGAEYMRSVGKKAIRTKYYPDLQSTTKIIEKVVEKIQGAIDELKRD